MKPEKPTGAKRVLFFLLLLLLLLLMIEGGAAIVTGIFVQRGWMAHVPSFSEDDVSRYLETRNQLLGWGPQTRPDGGVVNLTPRPDVLSNGGGSACIAAYGDSFTYGYGAADNATYPHHLANAVNCPVRNYGVDGYGSDQAMMLFRAQQHLDGAPIVILGHLSENILRNVNRYRGLLYPGSTFHFKPRFVVRGDQLEYLPIPVNTVRDFQALEEKPDSVLSGDALLARPRRDFPYTFSLFRWLGQDFKVRAEVKGMPAEATFYDPMHPAGGLDVTTRVLSTFVREAAAQRRHGVVLLIPTMQTLSYARKTGVWSDQPLADALRRENVPAIHAGPRILERLAGADPCSLFEACTLPHFTDVGNRLLAKVVAVELQRMGLIPNVVAGPGARARPN